MTNASKISTIKHEAETYLSQGLYKEALTVCKKFLANTKKLDSDQRKVIDESISRIRSAALSHNCKKDVSMSDVVVTMPKRNSKGGASAAVNDRLVNAQAFINAGYYERALKEYHQLLKKNYLTSAVIRGVALCLVHTVRPNHIENIVDRLANDIFNHPRNRKTFKRSIAKNICKDRYPRHFSALTHHVILVKEDST